MSIPYLQNSGTDFVRAHLTHFPRPDQAASQAIERWSAKQGVKLDIANTDVVTLHYQTDGQAGWNAVVAQRMSLTEALLGNWQGESDNNLVGALLHEPWAGHLPGTLHIVDKLQVPDALTNSTGYEVFNGLFRRESEQRYNSETHIPIAAETFQTFIWNLDFHTTYQSMLDSYWQDHAHDHSVSERINFIAACNKQVAEGSLSHNAALLAWRVAGLIASPTIVQARPLNVYGYTATDLICFKDKASGLTLLYAPGNSSPLQEFSTERHLKGWFAEQCKDPQKRLALEAHFPIDERADGLSYSGLHTALDGLAAYPERNQLSSNRPGFTTEGVWAPDTYVNYKVKTYSLPITGDLFEALAERQRLRSYRDADALITTAGQVEKVRWLGYLRTACNLLAPLALVVPELAIVFAVGGVAQFGLGLDQAINGKSAEQKASGVGDAVYGLLNAAPLAHALASERSLLFRYHSDRFVAPRELNGRMGYPLSPMDPPHFAEPQGVVFFRRDDNVIEAVAGGDPATAAAIQRIPRYDGEPDVMKASIGGYFSDVVYDIEADAFLTAADQNEVLPTYYRATLDSQNLRPVTGPRTVSDQTRMATLRALGIDLHLPVDLQNVPAQAPAELPMHISGIWVGDKVMETDLLTNIGRNAQLLEGTPWTYRLYLSNASTEAYERNLQLLTEHAPGLHVLPLESQPWFELFSQTPNHAQYQAAIEGNGGLARNYASASDLLRYHLLYHEGGIYMDLDDSFLAPGELPQGEAMGFAGRPLADLRLTCSEQGLLLPYPLSNEKLGMNGLFNNSLIASQAGNPTLLAIGAEMNERWLADPTFYMHKPDPLVDPEAFTQYARRLSYLTGPRLLSDMVDRQLPALAQLRQLWNLHGITTINKHYIASPEAILTAFDQGFPLSRLARIGGAQSWLHT
ncbi:dermonecrotic toxin domain-containing protein [Pseudomonas sp. NPDC089752]|uniref:dermonecrotic toxin domain-containing protein n=1 Tax=Pseudomonas sp. NPDC089752 TaxID=3364472 RepID=UPI003813286F